MYTFSAWYFVTFITEYKISICNIESGFFLSSDKFEEKTLFILVEHHPWNKMYKK